MTSYDTYRSELKKLKCCVIIPTYNNAATLKDVITRVQEFTDDVFVVNDGSTDSTSSILARIPAIKTISFGDNKGKGLALREGFKAALETGFHYAITLDSDSQHRPEEIPVFIEAIKKDPNSLIIGSRNMAQAGVPGTSNFGHRFSNFWYFLETGIDLPDTQSGYRLYPIKLLGEMKFYTVRYELELEILVRAAWKGIKVVPVPIDVIYPEDRVTHFRLFKDFFRISLLNTVLVIITILYIKPARFFQNLKKENRREFIRRNILMSEESNGKIAVAIMLGLFLGVSPIWGFHILVCIAMAHVLKLSKVVVLAAAHISIPPMIPVILYVSYKLGGFIVGNDQDLSYHSGFSFDTIQQDLFQYVIGSLILGAILAVCFGVLSYLTLSLFRKKPHLVRSKHS